jgi:hypothetical protein
MQPVPPEELVEELGASDEPVDSSEWQAGTFFGYIFMICVLIGFGVVMAVLAFKLVASNDKDRWLWLVFGTGMSLAFLGICFFWWVPFYRGVAKSIYLYEQGVVWKTAAKGWRCQKWADAKHILRFDVVNVVGPSGTLVRVLFEDGTELQFGPQIARYPVLAEQTQRFVHRCLIVEYRRQFEAGETLNFGPVTLDPTHVSVKGSSYTKGGEFELKNLDTVALGSGYVGFCKGDKQLAIAMLGDIPNYTILLALLPVKPAHFDPAMFE